MGYPDLAIAVLDEILKNSRNKFDRSKNLVPIEPAGSCHYFQHSFRLPQVIRLAGSYSRVGKHYGNQPQCLLQIFVFHRRSSG